jgi:hypothetical protein
MHWRLFEAVSASAPCFQHTAPQRVCKFYGRDSCVAFSGLRYENVVRPRVAFKTHLRAFLLSVGGFRLPAPLYVIIPFIAWIPDGVWA